MLRRQVTTLAATVEVKDATIRDLQDRLSDCQQDLGRVQGELEEARRESQARLAEGDSLMAQIKTMTKDNESLRQLARNQKEHMERTPSARRNPAPLLPSLPAVQYRQPGAVPPPAAVQKHSQGHRPVLGYPQHAEDPPALTAALRGSASSSHQGPSPPLAIAPPDMSQSVIFSRDARQGLPSPSTMAPSDRSQSASLPLRLLASRQAVTDHQSSNVQSHPQYQPADSGRLSYLNATTLNVGRGSGLAAGLSGLGPSSAQASDSNAVIAQSDPSEKFDLQASTVGLFDQIKAYCRRHANDTSLGIGDLPRGIQAQYHKICMSSNLEGIMKNHETRPLLTARLIIDIAVGEVWQPTMLLDYPLPAKVDDIRKAQSMIASSNDQRLLESMYIIRADAIKAISRHSVFLPFLSAKAKNDARTILRGIAPLFGKAGPNSIAISDFQELWYDVFRYGVDIFTLPHAYQFGFPPPGPKAWFQPATMKSIDPGVAGDSWAIKKADYRMSVAVTPVVTSTRTWRDRVVPEMVCKAEVLLCSGE